MKKQNILIGGILIIIVLVFLFFRSRPQHPVSQGEVSATLQNGVHEKPESSNAKISDNKNNQTEKTVAVSKNENEPKSAVKELTEADLKKIDQVRNNGKFALMVLYTAQKSFNEEYHRYTTDLKHLGYTPPGKELQFKFGFLKPIDNELLTAKPASSENPQYMNSDDFVGEPASSGNQRLDYSNKNVESISLESLAHFCRQRCTAGDDFFEMMLVFPIEQTGKNEVWLINDKKEIIQVVDGTK